MARQADRLMKIGLEGFAAIDENFGLAKRPPLVVNMASQADRLNEIALEGFEAIDENFCRNKKRSDPLWPPKWPPVRQVPSAHPTNYYVYQANQNPGTEVVNSNKAAQRYSGKVYTDYPKGDTSSVA